MGISVSGYGGGQKDELFQHYKLSLLQLGVGRGQSLCQCRLNFSITVRREFCFTREV